MTARWSICTPRAPGALAIIQLASPSADQLDAALNTLGLASIEPCQLRLADLLGVDCGIVARSSDRVAQLIPHGGPAVVSNLTETLTARGIIHDPAPDPRALYPEADSLLEARVLAALAAAPSPDAIDLLLDQPARWARPGAQADPALDMIRDRLLEPPLVVAVGPSNIGKSTLLNALAGRAVALVADRPGTTRDHVGVLVDLGGLVIRYIDTPGDRPDADPIERRARAIAQPLIDAADLVLCCGDASADPPTSPARPGSATLTVATRVDLGEPSFAHDIAVGGLDTESPSGLDALTAKMRAILLPDHALTDPAPWRFWADDPRSDPV